MCEQAKTRLERGAEAEAHCWATVWDWGIAGTFAVVVDVLSDVYNTFVFSANFQGRRSNDMPSNSAHCAASFWMSFVKDLPNPFKTFYLLYNNMGLLAPNPRQE